MPGGLVPTGTAATLFIPLLVWFCVTLVAGAAGGGYALWASTRGGDAASGVSGAVDVFDDVTAPDGGGAAAAAPRESWQINIKELRIGNRIGAGNVGEVHAGVFRGRPVAVKRLLRAWHDNEDMIGRFRDEIGLMAGMNHQNVLMFLGAVLDPEAGNVALVTELCERGTLADVLRSGDPLPWPRRLRMARDIAMGMDYLHTKVRGCASRSGWRCAAACLGDRPNVDISPPFSLPPHSLTRCVLNRHQHYTRTQ